MYFEVCVFWLKFLLRKCCTAVVEMFTYLRTPSKRIPKLVVEMFTYLQTDYNKAAATADSIRTQTSCLRVHQPSRATKKRKSTFCGAGVPNEHNDTNPTHNVMNTQTHTHTHWQVLYSSRKKGIIAYRNKV